MRKNFEQQLSIDIIPIGEVKIPDNKRDELPATLKALQYIYVTPELNQAVFSLLEAAVLKGKKKTGRTGMDLWHILVLGVVRMSLDTNWDRIWYLSNQDNLLRQIMGIELDRLSGYEMKVIRGKEFSHTSIRENVKLLDEATIEKINEIVIKAGHQLVKKKEEKLVIKADTYVLESNVHFPTDMNLLWDSAYKSLDMIGKLIKKIDIEGWRKIKDWKRRTKNQCRFLSKACQGGGKEKEKLVKTQAIKYLQIAKDLQEKIQESKEEFYSLINTASQLLILLELEYYQNMLIKHIDLIERRLLKGEVIPHKEKIFSIFESHAEWIKKGKANNKVEIGHKILIAMDQFEFIVFHKVIEHQEDVELSVPLADKLLQAFGENTIGSISFDKGFWKKENKELLQLYIEKVIMPKKGKPNKTEQAEESTKEFKKLRNNHSGVESGINCLEHHGLNRCPDKGMKGFKKYTAMGVLAYNLHKVGNAIMAKTERKPLRKAA